MEFENSKENSSSFLNSVKFIENTPLLEASAEAGSSRISSSQRMKYDAEVQLIKGRFGDLEDMRKRLGLSQRKISQLLMVDPSAWTRWTRENASAPPHIYRSLSWFLQLQEKAPENSPYSYLIGVSQPTLPAKEVHAIKDRLSNELQATLQPQLQAKLEKQIARWKWVIIGQFIVFFLYALFCS